MKILKFFSFLVLIALIAGFGYFAFTDVDVHPTEISREIPQERYIHDQ